jgi:hypothetical protein
MRWRPISSGALSVAGATSQVSMGEGRVHGYYAAVAGDVIPERMTLTDRSWWVRSTQARVEARRRP